MTDGLLFVVHGFPPVAGSGPNRAAAFCRYLPTHGWQPHVLTIDRAWAANRDDPAESALPPELAVVRTRSFEPKPGSPATASTPDPRESRGAAFAPVRLGTSSQAATPSRTHRGMPALKSHVAHAMRFPDAHVGWTPYAVAAGLRIARERRPRLLYSTAGPFTNHLVALLLHRRTGLPWVAELRDGWFQWNQAIFPDYPRWRAWLEGPLEAAVIRGAARVVLVTQLMAEAFRTRYTDLPKAHFRVVPNGFDPAQYRDLPPAAHRADRFEVLHAGALYHGRSVEAFLDAAGRLASSNAVFRRQFRLTLVGSLDGGARAEIDRQMARHALGQQVEYLGYLNHHSALAKMRTADLLLAIANTTPGAEATVPGKLFEYLAVGRPILAITPPGAEAAAVVRDTRSGWVAPAHDAGGIGLALRAAFHAHQQGRAVEPDASAVARFDRVRLAGELATIFDEVVRR